MKNLNKLNISNKVNQEINKLLDKNKLSSCMVCTDINNDLQDVFFYLNICGKFSLYEIAMISKLIDDNGLC